MVLWIEQQDSEFNPIPVGVRNPFGYDSAQWAFQADGRLASGEPFTIATFGLQDNGQAFCKVLGQPHYNPQLKAERKGGITRYRVTYPMENLGVKPKAGVALGTAVNINDNDGQGREGWLFWGEGIFPPQNPSLYRRIVLVDRSK